ncbi:PorP/SprF family type IX secretion system membrane protein [Ascidiimonas sp. W6]|uniref:PorP/SprF family type IX secretion system membrane protein n=1 Tax=Ascidiimonas meishanensis TaxID=3128903 RepID=UPI0030EC184C
MKKALFLFIISLLSFTTYSQEGLPVYFDYLSDNYYLIHPAMAGVGQGGKVRLTARKQWFDVEEAPSLQTLNAHVRLGDRSGVGAILFNDQNGYHSQTGIKLTYAHHLLFSRNMVDLNQLSFGMSVGLVQSNLDETEFASFFPDPIINGTDNSVSYFNVDIGMSYNFLEFYAHFTVQNALGTGRDLYTAQEFDNLRRYLLSAGYVFGKSDWQFEPSFLFQATEFTEEKTIDFNAKVYKDVPFGKVWAGLSYRTSFDGAAFNEVGGLSEQKLQLITPILGVNYKKFMFAYTYSYQTGDIRIDSGGFHQITLGYNFLGSDEKPYDCVCPAVNY